MLSIHARAHALLVYEHITVWASGRCVHVCACARVCMHIVGGWLNDKPVFGGMVGEVVVAVNSHEDTKPVGRLGGLHGDRSSWALSTHPSPPQPHMPLGRAACE